MDLVATKVQKECPDLVLFQEVWVSAYQRRLERTLGATYESIFVRRSMTGWPRGGLLVFVRRQTSWLIEQIAFTPFDRAAPWWRLTEGDGISGKGYLAVTLRRKDQRLVVVNTHLQSPYPEHSRSYEDLRHDQLEQLQKYILSLAAPQAVLIAGDFNTEPSEHLYSAHLSVLGVDLSVPERTQGDGGTHIDARRGRGGWIDYVFTRHFAVEATLVRIPSSAIDDPYSDHDGLLVRLTYDGDELR